MSLSNSLNIHMEDDTWKFVIALFQIKNYF